jgi:hypothetical protein
VNVGFLGKVAMAGMRSLDRNLASPGGSILACTRSWARKICAISSWDGSVVDNARVEGLVRPLPDDFQMWESLSGMGPLQLEWRDAGRVRCGYARDYDYYLSLNNVRWTECGLASSGERARVDGANLVIYGGVLQPFRWRRCQAGRLCGP